MKLLTAPPYTNFCFCFAISRSFLTSKPPLVLHLSCSFILSLYTLPTSLFFFFQPSIVIPGDYKCSPWWRFVFNSIIKCLFRNLKFLHFSVYMYVWVCLSADIPADYCFVYVLFSQYAQALGSYICKHLTHRDPRHMRLEVRILVCACLNQKSLLVFFFLFNNIYKKCCMCAL